MKALPVIRETDAGQAQEVAERLRETIASTPFPFGNQTIELSVSIGLATTMQSCEQAALLRLADAALYEAKEGGRNRVVVSSVSVPA